MAFADPGAIVIGLRLGQRGFDVAQFTVAIERIVDCGRDQRRRFLGDMSNDPARGHLKIALILMQFATQQREQARLAAAIGASQTDLPPGMNLKIDRIDQHLGATCESQVAELDHLNSTMRKRVILLTSIAPRSNPASMLRTLTLALLLATSSAALADNPDALPDLAEARAMQAEAKALRDLAESEFRATEPGCYERFLVNRCLEQARALRLERIRAARALEIEARRIELAHNRAQAEAESRAEGVTRTDTAIPTPTAIPEIPVDDAAAHIRAQREAQARDAEALRQQQLQQQDAQRAADRARAEEAAARRAERAERDRERYDERIRERYGDVR